MLAAGMASAGDELERRKLAGLDAHGGLLQYAAFKGSRIYREGLSKFINRHDEAAPADALCQADLLMTTNGVSHGIDLCASRLASPGDSVIVESATYFLAAQIFRDHGLNVISLPFNESGFCVADVEEAVRGSDSRCRLLYLCPSAGNPSGRTVSASDRAELVAVCRRLGVLIVADEVYHSLTWGNKQKTPPRMCVFDEEYVAESATLAASKSRAGNAEASDDEEDDVYVLTLKEETATDRGDKGVVVSLGSWTKILSPGLRLGWIEATSDILNTIQKSGYVTSSGGVAPFPEAIVSSLLEDQESPIDRHLEHVRAAYAERAAAMVAALKSFPRHFPQILQNPDGGFFLFVRVNCDAHKLIETAQSEEYSKLSFLPGDRCAATPAAAQALRAKSWIRLCFAMLDVKKIRRGITELARAIDNLGA